MADGAGLNVAPLAPFAGERPPAPAWFDEAMGCKPEEMRVKAAGAEVEVLAWGERGRPGVMLLHGAGAHAGWWRFIAPWLADERRVVAYSLSGMGGSDWRQRYVMDVYAEEMLAVAEAAGLFDAKAKPVVAAHSFGARPAMRLAAREGERLAGVIAIDTFIRPLGTPTYTGGLWEPRPTKVYPTLAAALARFRLAPLQPCENLFLVDAVARESLGPPRDGREGWTWRFDPMLWANLDRSVEMAADFLAVRCRTALIFGDRSRVMGPEDLAHVRAMAPHVPLTLIPESEHHVMLDQPLALTAALRAHLALWSREARA